MAKTKCTFEFTGWRMNGVLYPPDQPPQEARDRIIAAVKQVLKPKPKKGVTT